MKKPIVRKLRCAVYTRKSSEEGLDMEFNSLDAQREACEAYVASQKPEGWVPVSDRYDDGGFFGGTLERPARRSPVPSGGGSSWKPASMPRLPRSPPPKRLTTPTPAAFCG